MPEAVPDMTQWDAHDVAQVEWYRTNLKAPTKDDLRDANADLGRANLQAYLNNAHLALDRANAGLDRAKVDLDRAQLRPQYRQQPLPPHVSFTANTDEIVTRLS